ncbi:hypothetical protein P9112_012688 [Eukaryota sp. TZLM1-RC]
MGDLHFVPPEPPAIQSIQPDGTTVPHIESLPEVAIFTKVAQHDFSKHPLFQHGGSVVTSSTLDEESDELKTLRSSVFELRSAAVFNAHHLSTLLDLLENGSISLATSALAKADGGESAKHDQLEILKNLFAAKRKTLLSAREVLLSCAENLQKEIKIKRNDLSLLLLIKEKGFDLEISKDQYFVNFGNHFLPVDVEVQATSSVVTNDFCISKLYSELLAFIRKIGIKISKIDNHFVRRINCFVLSLNEDFIIKVESKNSENSIEKCEKLAQVLDKLLIKSTIKYLTKKSSCLPFKVVLDSFENSLCSMIINSTLNKFKLFISSLSRLDLKCSINVGLNRIELRICDVIISYRAGHNEDQNSVIFFKFQSPIHSKFSKMELSGVSSDEIFNHVIPACQWVVHHFLSSHQLNFHFSDGIFTLPDFDWKFLIVQSNESFSIMLNSNGSKSELLMFNEFFSMVLERISV